MPQIVRDRHHPARIAIASVLLLLVSARADAASRVIDGATFPDTIQADGATLALNGAAARVFFMMVDGYASSLYVRQPAHDLGTIEGEPNPKLIRTVFLHNASAAQLRTELTRIHRRYCASNACAAADDSSYQTMLDHIQAVTAGESETLLVTDRGVVVTLGAGAALQIDNPHFGVALLGSMLGESAPTERLRRGLLGLPN